MVYATVQVWRLVDNTMELVPLQCGGLNKFGPHVFKCLANGNGTIRRCGLFEIGVALLEEVCHCGSGL